MKKSSLFLIPALMVMFNACSPAVPVSTGATGINTVDTAPAAPPVEAPALTGIVEPVLVPSDILAEFGLTGEAGFSTVPPPEFEAAGESRLGPSLPVDMAQIMNIDVAASLTPEAQDALRENGFVVVQTGDRQFSDTRRRVSEIYGQPYYLTTDAAFHALHLTYDEVLKALEKEQFLPLMIEMTSDTLAEVREYRAALAGSGLEEDAALAEAYLSLGLKLFDPSFVLDPKMAEAVRPQMEQIRAEEGRNHSALIPGFEDDYSAYRPVGHYAGDPLLENYFRGMAWFGRVQFQLASDVPGFKPSRAPLLITLALRQKGAGGAVPAELWGKLHETLTWMIGPLDDGGPLEYAALMDAVYGKGHALEDLKDEDAWRRFVDSREALPAPQINSTFADSLSDLAREHGWRFTGQRFTLDAFFLQNLVYDRVGTIEKPRKLPSGLDVMAILGSEPAGQVLEENGETAYARYPEQQAALMKQVEEMPAGNWWKTIYSTWLYAFQAQVAPKDGAFPPYMRNRPWAFKELNSALGSWAELKHDTSLYTKMPEYGAGGGPPASGPAPAFVEPNPDAFYGMAFAVQNLADGLTLRGMNTSLAQPEEGDFTFPAGIERLIMDTSYFGSRLQELGDIAARELAGESLTGEDYEEIQACLGPVECQVMIMQNMHEHGVGPSQEMPPLPVAAAVAGADDKILQVAVGDLNRIYVVVPLEGGLQIAQGNVFSYYEFVHPRAERLTDEAWRELLAEGRTVPPAWAGKFLFTGGEAADVTAFRVGDWYIITAAGDDLNVRGKPGTQGKVVGKLFAGDYVEIIDGPETVAGSRWWKVRQDWMPENALEGWVIEDQAWYERAHGQ